MPPTNQKSKTATATSCLEQIGSTAGKVWHVLNEKNSNGTQHPGSAMSLTQLAKEVDAPRDVIMQAVGWLAREGKVEVAEKGRSRTIGLK